MISHLNLIATFCRPATCSSFLIDYEIRSNFPRMWAALASSFLLGYKMNHDIDRCASVALSEENCLFGKIWEDRQEEHNFLCSLQAPVRSLLFKLNLFALADPMITKCVW